MTNIYHITHIDNLSSIVNNKGLWCDNECLRQNTAQVNIAYQNLKARRRKTPVAVAAGGVLGDYVPFYFTTRSPMLFTITRGNVPDVQINQRDIIYLVSSVEQIAEQKDCLWCFTDGHAVEKFSNFYTALADLTLVDWEVIGSRNWADTGIDPQRQRKKQAEFLVYHYFPLAWIKEIGVADNRTATRINAILGNIEPRPAISISVRTSWYYELE